MSGKSLVLFVMGAFMTTVAVAADDTASPICCAKRAYCCSIKARCCENNKLVEEEIIPLTFVKEAAAKPVCCDKRAYCCTIKAPCCGKTLLIEVAALPGDEQASTNDTGGVAQPICCLKRAYCCTIKATCCGAETTANFETKELDKETLAAFAADRDTSLPVCCMKRAYCCTLKSPCCGKTLELEIVR